VGANALRSHHTSPWTVLLRQLRSPLLILLVVTAAVSFFVGDRTDAIIIGVILALSTLLGYLNEYRAEQAAEDLHKQLRHQTVVCRDGSWSYCDVTDLVPGDVVRLAIGVLVPAYLTLVELGKVEFFRHSKPGAAPSRNRQRHRIHRRADRFSLRRPPPDTTDTRVSRAPTLRPANRQSQPSRPGDPHKVQGAGKTRPVLNTTRFPWLGSPRPFAPGNTATGFTVPAASTRCSGSPCWAQM